MHLTQMIYASTMTDPLSLDLVVQVLDTARDRNPRHGVTGMLVFGTERFLQLIEGPPEAVNRLYRNLVADPRHRDLRLISAGPVAARRFTDWSMGFWTVARGASPAAASGEQGRFAPHSLTPDAALRLLDELAGQAKRSAA